MQFRAVASFGTVMGRTARGRQQAWGRGVQNGSLVFVRTLGRTLRSAMGGYPTLGARGEASPSLTGPPLALPLTRSPGTLRAEFPFRRITRRTPQFTLTSPSQVSMLPTTTVTRGGNYQGATGRVGICNVSTCVLSSPQTFYPHLQLGCFTQLSPSRDARIHYA